MVVWSVEPQGSVCFGVSGWASGGKGKVGREYYSLSRVRCLNLNCFIKDKSIFSLL